MLDEIRGCLLAFYILLHEEFKALQIDFTRKDGQYLRAGNMSFEKAVRKKLDAFKALLGQNTGPKALCPKLFKRVAQEQRKVLFNELEEAKKKKVRIYLTLFSLIIQMFLYHVGLEAMSGGSRQYLGLVGGRRRREVRLHNGCRNARLSPRGVWCC